MKGEFHIFIIWENAESWRNEILCDLKSHFEIAESFKMCWPKEKFSENLTRFYAFKITKESENESVVGTGEFELLVVRDRNPVYGDRMTAKQGVHYVNTNIFDAKTRYRNLTGKFRVHATNSSLEFRHDIALLLGVSDKEYYNGNYGNMSRYAFFGRQLTGMNGWKDVQEVLFVLENCTDAVIEKVTIIDETPHYKIATESIEKTKLTLGMESYEIETLLETQNGKLYLEFVEK